MEDYEKKYKEALEKAKSFNKRWQCVGATNSELALKELKEIFPELRGDEDEKIRKALVRFHKSTIDIDGIKGADILAWLEKQGNNTPTIIWHNIDEKPEKMKELFCEWESDDATWHDVAFYDEESDTFRRALLPINVTKWIYVDELLEKQGEKVEPIEGFNTEFERQISQLIASIINKEHEYTEAFVKWTSDALLNYAKHEIDKQGEQKPAVIIPKFRVGDEIKTSNEESLTITKIDEKGYWSEDLFICGFDDADNWKLVEQKPAEWSEEDEEMLKWTNGNLTELKEQFGEKYGKVGECISWLKSIKDRATWKPTEEQITVINDTIRFIENKSDSLSSDYLYNKMKELLKQLKAL